MSLDQYLNGRLDERRRASLYRARRELGSAQGASVRLGADWLLNFCSNDYLGLANHPQLREAFVAAAARFGVGSGASHLVCGHGEAHHQLELALAAFTGRPRALLFSTGYMANLGTISALLSRKDALLQDKLNHASLIDAGQLSGADLLRFKHNDLTHLQARLTESSATRKLIAVDGVFSMDGDLAPLSALAALAKAHDAWLMVDDAHGFGVLGQCGAGTAEHCGLHGSEVPILMGTLGKALGCFGAFVAGSEALIEALIQFARPYIYTTALPPAVAAASLAALRIVQQEPERRAHLHSLVAHFRALASAAELPIGASTTPIQPLLVGDDARALELSQWLLGQGIWVSAIRPPTVPKGTARLRITLSAAHSLSDVERLVERLAAGCKQLQVTL